MSQPSAEGHSSVKDSYLRELYYDPKSPVAYSSIRNIWKHIKNDENMNIKYKELKEFLPQQPTYTKHKKDVNKFIRRKVMVSFIDQQWQADLIDMRYLEEENVPEGHSAKPNQGYKWILTIIDIFSRYAWARALKSKSGSEVADKFKNIFQESQPLKIQFDEGKEFYNRSFKELLNKKGIEYFSTKSDKKAAIVERFNKTLKNRMWKYFEENETKTWIHILQDLVHGYNNSFHSSIDMKPIEARNPDNSEIVWYNLYGAFLTNEFGEPKYKIGDRVRISKYKHTFHRGYLANFTEEIFKIKNIIYTKPIVYKLEDLQNEDIEGYFYEEELSYVPNPDQLEYKIEKVLKKKTVKGKKYGLVKWKGYPDKFNEWIALSEIKKLEINTLK